MASIGEVQSGIALANQKASESLGALQQAHSQLEEAQNSLTRVTEGSAQSDVNDAVNQLQHAISSLSEVQNQVRSAIDTAEGISQRL